MIDQKVRAQIDQAIAFAVETLPPMLMGMYRGCIKEGFTEAQAMQIVLSYVSGLAAHK